VAALHGAEPRLAAAGVQAEVADELSRRREAVDATDRAHRRRGGRDVDAGIVISRRISG
jgi:hypothetical protein